MLDRVAERARVIEPRQVPLLPLVSARVRNASVGLAQALGEHGVEDSTTPRLDAGALERRAARVEDQDPRLTRRFHHARDRGQSASLSQC
jgi:hypothetical protein